MGGSNEAFYQALETGEGDPFPLASPTEYPVSGPPRLLRPRTSPPRLPIQTILVPIVCFLLAFSLLPFVAPFFAPTCRAQTPITNSTCTPTEWSSGQWRPKFPLLHQNSTALDVFQASGFLHGCESQYMPPFALGVEWNDEMKMTKYRWDAGQYEWVAKGEGECRDGVKRAQGEEMLKDMITKGGWMLLGDSISEFHLFSLSCILAPHVRHDLSDGYMHQRFYLREDSSLVKADWFPANFSINETPVMSHVRTDHGWTQVELEEVYLETPSAATYDVGAVFTDYPITSGTFQSYMDVFFEPKNHYRVLIHNTGAHFTQREFAFPEPNNHEMVELLYGALALNWTAKVAEELKLRDPEGLKEVLVRSATGGHDDCKASLSPVDKEIEWSSTEFNWARIPILNSIFDEVIRNASHPQITFLDIDRPSNLRPDAHTYDCLHMSAGTGVYEGWTDYIAYWLKQREDKPVANLKVVKRGWW